MPIYEYKCHECGGVSEFLISKSNNKQNVHCIHCSSAKVEKIFSVLSLPKNTSTDFGSCQKSCMDGMGAPGRPPCSGGTCPL
ncbi:zinc ribbon domain-containing protein [Chlamydiota bacterium]